MDNNNFIVIKRVNLCFIEEGRNALGVTRFQKGFVGLLYILVQLKSHRYRHLYLCMKSFRCTMKIKMDNPLCAYGEAQRHMLYYFHFI